MDLTKTNEKVQKYLSDCLSRYPQLKGCGESIERAFYKMKHTFAEGGQLLLCGNGGSAADADHISGELLKGFGQKRPLSKEWVRKLGPEIASKLQGALKAIPLTAFNALTTAYGNDCDPLYTFAQLVWALGQAGDTLLAISTSGNSENVLLAAQVARAKGMQIVGLTGKSGGKLKNFVDVCICAPEDVVFKIQELHLPIYHTLMLMLEEAFFGNEKA